MAPKRKVPKRTPAERVYLMAVGKRVRVRRHEFDWSLEQLAERAHMHPTYVSAIERGERNVGIIKIGHLASALEIDVGQLFEGLSPRR